MTTKNFDIRSEGDMENVLKEFLKLAKTKAKKKTINIKIASEGLSHIVINNVNNQFKEHQVVSPADFHVHFFIQE